jgi:GT2 family glycosyltransferase
VTVAVCTFNRAHLVGRAIASALAQTFRDIEILVVDDASSDGTPEVLARLDDSRIRIVRLERNGGISRARNTAIAQARGEWLAFLDDDNEWVPKYLDRQLALAESHPESAVVYCRAQCRDERTGCTWLSPMAIRQGRVFRHLVEDWSWNLLMSCTLLRRSALREIDGLDETLKASEDRDLWFRLAQRTEFTGTPDALVVRHEHTGARLSRNDALLARDGDVLDAKWKTAITATCGRIAYRRWRARLALDVEIVRAINALESGGRLEGARCVGRMVCHAPWSAPAMTRVLAMTVLGLPAYEHLRALRSALRAGLRRAIAARRREPVEPREVGRARRDDLGAGRQ